MVNGTSGTITGGSWTYANQVGAQLSIVGKQNPTIGSVSIPAFSMQSGTVNIRSVTFSSLSSMGISASGGTLDLEYVTVSGCVGGGILLNNTAFDIENTTVKNNGPSSDLTWGGIRVQSLPASGPTKFNLVTITGNNPSGMSCATGAAPMGTGGICLAKHDWRYQRDLQHHDMRDGERDVRVPTMSLDARCFCRD